MKISKGICKAGLALILVSPFSLLQPASAQVLTFVEALFDGDTDGAGNPVDDLDGAVSVMVSPGGKHVYAAAELDNALSVFSRDARTGQLTFVEVHKDGIGEVDGLSEASAVTVSPDGRHVYAAGEGSGTMAVFSRDARTGQLTFVEVLEDGAGGVDGLLEPNSVTVSPNGKHVYATSEPDGVAVFSRDSRTGQLTFVETLADGGTDGAGNTIDGLASTSSITVSPDGKHAYVTAEDDNSVAVFSRDARTGQLTFVEVLTDGGTDGAGNTIDGLGGAESVIVSPDGRYVYSAGDGARLPSDVPDAAVAVFSRDPRNGRLTFVEALFDGGTDDAGNTIDGLGAVISVTVSPNGQHIYTASEEIDPALAVFRATKTLRSAGP